MLVVLITCLGFISYHRQHSVETIENAMSEAASIVAKPLWQFDFKLIESYFTASTGKYAFVSLRVVDLDGSVIYEWEKAEPDKGQQVLTVFRLAPLRTFAQSIEYNYEKIGTISAVWQDDSIYYCTYAVVLSALLMVIIHLYSRNVNAKRSLEGKVQLIEKQMNELRSQKEFIENIFKIVPEGLITLGSNGAEVHSNHAFETIVKEWASLLSKDNEAVKTLFLDRLWTELQEKSKGQYSILIDGYTFIIEFLSSKVPMSIDADTVVSLRDISKLTEMERELNQSRKLEAVGRLAAGIAHEINTPTQYVFTNVDFLTDAFTDIAAVMQEIGDGMESSGCAAADRLKKIEDVYNGADWGFLEEEIPKALSQSKDGLRKVSSIVSAMKHFSHPSGNSAEPANINSAIENTVIVARNEWKYVAEVSLDLAPDLPLIPCFLDDFNQVILGMIVNSAHAIAQKYGDSSETRGAISISTGIQGEHAIIVLRDDGMGISKGVQEKIFDPFFTTKELNKGTGQGLAIARDIIVNKHHGTISVDSEEGVGTTFTIALPML